MSPSPSKSTTTFTSTTRSTKRSDFVPSMGDQQVREFHQQDVTNGQTGTRTTQKRESSSLLLCAQLAGARQLELRQAGD
jgi:hypothetical protein